MISTGDSSARLRGGGIACLPFWYVVSEKLKSTGGLPDFVIQFSWNLKDKLELNLT